MWFKKNWPALVAAALQAESLWKFLKWALDWRGRYDGLAATYHEIGGASAMIGYILDPPPWFYPLAFFVGLILIWWNFRRNRRNVHIHHVEVREHAGIGVGHLGTPSRGIESPPILSKTIASSDYHWQFDSQMAVEIAARLRNRTEWKDKIIIDVTPEHIWNLFRRGSTTMEGETLTRRFLNKWMVVCGPFRDVRRLPRNAMVVNFARRNDLTIVFMYFNEDSHDALELLIPNQKISVVGRVDLIKNDSLNLEDCKLVQ
jgi:hypothetical protein